MSESEHRPAAGTLHWLVSSALETRESVAVIFLCSDTITNRDHEIVDDQESGMAWQHTQHKLLSHTHLEVDE